MVLNVHAPAENKCDDTKDSFYEELIHALHQYSAWKFCWEISKAKMDKEDIFKLTAGNESLCETSIDNMDVVINYATSKSLKDIDSELTKLLIIL
jgi:hypothetical protein